MLTGGGHESLPPAPGVRSLGSVPVAELASLYRRASALVFPSRYEGFGSPVLEAMACGARSRPLRSRRSRRSRAGRPSLFAPDSAEEIAAGILAALADAPALAARGLVRARGVHVGAGRGGARRCLRRAGYVESDGCARPPPARAQPVLLAGRRGDGAPADRALRGARRGLRRDGRHGTAARPRGRAATPRRRNGVRDHPRPFGRRSTARQLSLPRRQLRAPTSARAAARALSLGRRRRRSSCMTDPPMVGDVAVAARPPLSRAGGRASARTSSPRSRSS